jgi:hypothetical protein
MLKFSVQEREIVRSAIVNMASTDPRVTGGALVGSGAISGEDEWSDLDLTFGIRTDITPITVLDDWTKRLEATKRIVHHFDVLRGSAIYRVILFEDGLELDLSVVPQEQFGALAPGFKLLFGEAIERSDFPSENAGGSIGWGWHHILHANSAIRRGRSLQAIFWINGLRDHILALICIRHGLPSAQARGAHLLPKEALMQFEDGLPKSLNARELRECLELNAKLFSEELRMHNDSIASRLDPVITSLLRR